jgi:integral membrane sensor domain MASE1
MKALRAFWSTIGSAVRKVQWQHVLRLALTAAAYVIAAKAGLTLAVATKQVTTVWPPTAIALAITFIAGYRYLPGIYIGAFIANALTNEPLAVAAGIAVGNTLEAAVGAWLLKEVVRFNSAFDGARDLLVFIVCIGMISTPVSASIGTLSLMLGGLAQPSHFLSVWSTWWAGDAMAGLILGPFLLVWFNKECREVLRGRVVEAGLIFAALLLVTAISFTLHFHPGWPVPLAAYVIFPMMIWIAFTFNRLGVTAGALVVWAVALWATLHGFGPFAETGTVEENLIFLQSLVLVLFGTSMFLAITVARRMRAERALRNVARELKEANGRVTDILAEVLDQATPPVRTLRGHRREKQVQASTHKINE